MFVIANLLPRARPWGASQEFTEFVDKKLSGRVTGNYYFTSRHPLHEIIAFVYSFPSITRSSYDLSLYIVNCNLITVNVHTQRFGIHGRYLTSARSKSDAV